jgi:anti-sigma regulatory factor (Ser/Thr protein kinase)
LTKVRRRLAPDVRAPGEARAFVASQCPGLSAEAMDVLRLLTTEIVDNAMWHAAPGPLWLDVEAEPDHVAVGVTDAGGGEVRLAPDNHWPETGHGLRLVDALSARWGVEPAAEPPGKRVWFEMAWQDAREVAVPRPRRWEERRHAHRPPAPTDGQPV